MVREITKDEFRRRTGGTMDGWFTEAATGFYEIDPEGSPLCPMEQVPALFDHLIRNNLIGFDGWIPKVRSALEKYKPGPNPDRG